jgi:glycine dehydrogenase subunit 2
VDLRLQAPEIDRTCTSVLRKFRSAWCARWPYILAHGGNGLRNATIDAVSNANYIRKGLEPYFDLPYKAANMHEVVFSDDRQGKLGVHTGDIAKR